MKLKGNLTFGKMLFYLVALIIVIIPLTTVLITFIAGATASSPFILIGFLVYKKWKYNLRIKADERKYTKLGRKN